MVSGHRPAVQQLHIKDHAGAGREEGSPPSPFSRRLRRDIRLLAGLRRGVEAACHSKLAVCPPSRLGRCASEDHPSLAFAALRRAKDGQGGIRTPEGVSQQIYSLPPLAAWVPARLEAEGLRAPALPPESWDLQLELAVGLAPTTACLQNRCSTVELRQLVPSLSRHGRSDARVVLPAAADSRDGNGHGQALRALFRPPSLARRAELGRYGGTSHRPISGRIRCLSCVQRCRMGET